MREDVLRKLKTVILLLQNEVSENTWRRFSLPLVDAIALLQDDEKRIRGLARENQRLKAKLVDAESDRDYWQHKWGNGNG